MIRSIDQYTRAQPSHQGPSSSSFNNPNSPATTYTSASTASYNTAGQGFPQQLSSRPDVKTKLVCVGDGGVGKTCLLMVYSGKPFPQDYCPTVFENYVCNRTHEGKVVEFALWDTAGQEEYDRLRPLSYPESHVVFICFSVDFPTSLENIEDKWFPEVAHFCEGVPIILIATKIDLRSDSQAIGLLAAQGRHPVTTEEGAAAAKRIGAKYAEVSAVKYQGVEEVFELALRESMKGRGGLGGFVNKRKTKKCNIL